LTSRAPGFIRASAALVEQPAGLRAERDDQHDDVAGREQLVELGVGRRRVVVPAARPVPHVAAEGAEQLRGAPADGAHADDADPAAR
jgi:hypothetical protein